MSDLHIWDLLRNWWGTLLNHADRHEPGGDDEVSRPRVISINPVKVVDLVNQAADATATIDVTAQTSEDAKWVILLLKLRIDIVQAAGRIWLITYETGTAPGAYQGNIFLNFGQQGATFEFYTQVWVSLDASRQFDYIFNGYTANAGQGDVEIWVLGYYEEP